MLAQHITSIPKACSVWGQFLQCASEGNGVGGLSSPRSHRPLRSMVAARKKKWQPVGCTSREEGTVVPAQNGWPWLAPNHAVVRVVSPSPPVVVSAACPHNLLVVHGSRFCCVAHPLCSCQRRALRLVTAPFARRLTTGAEHHGEWYMAQGPVSQHRCHPPAKPHFRKGRTVWRCRLNVLGCPPTVRLW